MLNAYHSFYINLPVGGLSIILLFFFFKTPPQAMPPKATWKEKLGGQKEAWNSSTVIGLLVGSILIWVAFAVWEYFYDERAMLQRRLFIHRFVWQPSAFQFFFAASYFMLLYYLPIYFQSVDNRSAIGSGVLNLPLVLAFALGSTIGGITASKTRHAAPFMVGGVILATISAGLMYTFDIGTSMGKWIGYQILFGAGSGLGFNMGMTIAQANTSMEDMASVTSIVLCKFGTGFLYQVWKLIRIFCSFSKYRRGILNLRGTVCICESHGVRARQNSSKYRPAEGCCYRCHPTSTCLFS